MKRRKNEGTKQSQLKVVYKYLEPASEEERKEAERRIEGAYAILFEEMFKDEMNEKNSE